MTVEIGVVLVPLAANPSVREELAIPDDAAATGYVVREQNLAVEVHYTTRERQPIPRRVQTTMGPGAVVHGARHFLTYEWLGQLWHVFVEVDQE